MAITHLVGPVIIKAAYFWSLTCLTLRERTTLRVVSTSACGWFLLLLAGYNRLLPQLFNLLGMEASVAGGNPRDLSLCVVFCWWVVNPAGRSKEREERMGLSSWPKGSVICDRAQMESVSLCLSPFFRCPHPAWLRLLDSFLVNHAYQIKQRKTSRWPWQSLMRLTVPKRPEQNVHQAKEESIYRLR